jgi:hypothetical protein
MLIQSEEIILPNQWQLEEIACDIFSSLLIDQNASIDRIYNTHVSGSHSGVYGEFVIAAINCQSDERTIYESIRTLASRAIARIEKELKGGQYFLILPSLMRLDRKAYPYCFLKAIGDNRHEIHFGFDGECVAELPENAVQYIGRIEGKDS